MTKARAVCSGTIALLILISGCNSRLLRPPAIINADGGGAVVDVTVGNATKRFTSAVLSYLPSQVPLHAGDSVNFALRNTGEPHTIALGRLVDTALSQIDALSPTSTLAQIEAVSGMRRLPSVFPTVPGAGPLRINRSAAERCFMDRGTPPVSASGGAPPCAKRDQPEFDGTQAFYSAGLLDEEAPFRVKLSPDIRPGLYRFMCLVHRASMTGTIEVRPPKVERPRVSEVREDGIDELDDVINSLRAPARQAFTERHAGILAGAGPSGRFRGYITAFVPDDFRVHRGETVTWKLFGTHSISFSVERKAKDGFLLRDKQGRVRLNVEAWRPVGRRVATRLPGPLRVAYSGGDWSGGSALSSGILFGSPPASVNYSVRFTTPGTYRYQCLVHTRMRGRVVVT